MSIEKLPRQTKSHTKRFQVCFILQSQIHLEEKRVYSSQQHLCNNSRKGFQRRQFLVKYRERE